MTTTKREAEQSREIMRLNKVLSDCVDLAFTLAERMKMMGDERNYKAAMFIAHHMIKNKTKKD